MAKKMKRGTPQKQCPKCGKKVHARLATCSCGHKFTSAKKKTAPTRKKKTAPRRKKKTVSGLRAQLLLEREALQKRAEAIDALLETYGS